MVNLQERNYDTKIHWVNYKKSVQAISKFLKFITVSLKSQINAYKFLGKG